MCRSIKVLRNPSQSATDDEVTKAALQFVRKISGFHTPSKVNQAAFERAVMDIAAASRQLLDSIEVRRGIVRDVAVSHPEESTFVG
jgi:hypothetical protein